MSTITGTTKAWFSGDFYGPAEMKADGPKCVSHLSYFGGDMTKAGWALIGEATITINVPDDEALVANKVEALRGKATRIRADAQVQLTEIEGKINQLLALTNCVEQAHD